jgi:hypothetical protein
LYVFRFAKRMDDYNLQVSKYETAFKAWQEKAEMAKKAAPPPAASPLNPSGSESGAARAGATLLAMAGSTDPVR